MVEMEMMMAAKLRILPILASLILSAFYPGMQLVSKAQNQPAQPMPVLAPTPIPGTIAKQALAVGPDQFPDGVNPLTGLPVKDPSLLSLPPAMISVANFPVSGRPQAGLSFSPYVFEVFIGEGMTRFLALFYGEFPQKSASFPAQSSLATDKAVVGPIRSGRLSYESLRRLYNGFLVMASASQEVRMQLNGSTNIFGSDNDNINSALIDVTKLQTIAQANATGKSRNLTGNLFNQEPPQGGQAASKLWVFYSFLNQIMWTYDPASQAYLRAQDKADGSGKFYPSTDRLTGKQLAFENVIVLFAKHNVLNGSRTLIDLDLFFTRNRAYLFRDGKVYPIYWSTVSGDYEKATGLMRPIRFVDRQGDPFQLKPGKTWVEVVDETATLTENDPASWKARFYAP